MESKSIWQSSQAQKQTQTDIYIYNISKKTIQINNLTQMKGQTN